jgi:hypothetical protein
LIFIAEAASAIFTMSEPLLISGKADAVFSSQFMVNHP